MNDQWQLELVNHEDRVVATALLFADEHRAIKAAEEENLWLSGEVKFKLTPKRYWRAAKVMQQ